LPPISWQAGLDFFFEVVAGCGVRNMGIGTCDLIPGREATDEYASTIVGISCAAAF